MLNLQAEVPTEFNELALTSAGEGRAAQWRACAVCRYSARHRSHRPLAGAPPLPSSRWARSQRGRSVGGADSRTLHLQVHLAHLSESVAEVHGKLFDHCRGGGKRKSESVSQTAILKRGGASASPSPAPPSPRAWRPPAALPTERLTLEIVLQVQHGGGEARARGAPRSLQRASWGGWGGVRKKKARLVPSNMAPAPPTTPAARLSENNIGG